MLYLLSMLSDSFGPFRCFEYVTFRRRRGVTAFLLVVLLGVGRPQIKGAQCPGRHRFTG